jgi:hypothetical protein
METPPFGSFCIEVSCRRKRRQLGLGCMDAKLRPLEDQNTQKYQKVEEKCFYRLDRRRRRWRSVLVRRRQEWNVGERLDGRHVDVEAPVRTHDRPESRVSLWLELRSGLRSRF